MKREAFAVGRHLPALGEPGPEAVARERNDEAIEE